MTDDDLKPGPLLFNIDAEGPGNRLGSWRGYKAPTFVESMRAVTDEHLAEMEAQGDYYTARLMRSYRDAVRARDRECDEEPTTPVVD